MLHPFDVTPLRDTLATAGIGDVALRRLTHALLRRFEANDTALAALPAVRHALGGRLHPGCLRLAGRHDAADGASRLLLATEHDDAIETVILRFAGRRTTVCVSAQVGCPMGCVFCATGRLKRARNLTRAEILEQVLIAGRIARDEGRQLRNVVFMGMGEPLLNEAAVIDALETLRGPFGLSERHLLVSTVGIPSAMVTLARRFPDGQLALSLHAARPEIRALLVPTARSGEPALLRDTLLRIQQVRRRDVMIELVLLDGINDGERDFAALVDFLAGLRAHVNLIAWNAIDGSTDLRASPASMREDWRRRLRAAGIRCTLRRSLGGEIDAACGQLAAAARRSPAT